MFLNRQIQWAMVAILLICAWATQPLVTQAAPVVSGLDGAQLFSTHCAGCHPGGGNIVRRGKSLKMRDLKRQHVDSVEAIATLTTNGKGLMSAYGERLTPAEIASISDYVWQQAQQNWKQ
ncbi:MAG: c-type cytochrome [Leptolyngbyaceae cyanobacterium]